jgi:hypothetical protein
MIAEAALHLKGAGSLPSWQRAGPRWSVDPFGFSWRIVVSLRKPSF